MRGNPVRQVHGPNDDEAEGEPNEGEPSEASPRSKMSHGRAAAISLKRVFDLQYIFN